MIFELKYLFYRTNKVFPIAYQEALLSGNDTIPLGKFSAQIARRLRLANQKAHVVAPNTIQIDDFAAILCTRKEVDSERARFLPFLAARRLQIGYIVQVSDYPYWGCILVSRSDWPKVSGEALDMNSPLPVNLDLCEDA